MTESDRIAGLAEQMELARKYLDEWPQWLRIDTHLAAANHTADAAVACPQDSGSSHEADCASQDA